MNYQTIIIAGVEYFLVPKVTQKSPDEEILSGYAVADDSLPVTPSATEPVDEFADETSVQVQQAPVNTAIEEAEGKPSEHRKKFIDRTLGSDELNKGKGIPIDNVRNFRDINEVDQAEYKGDKLFFGEGLQIG